jgi:hypothetical protein
LFLFAFCLHILQILWGVLGYSVAGDSARQAPGEYPTTVLVVLIGHQSQIGDVAVHPGGKWIASTESERTADRLWATPEGQPFQSLPYAELLTRLRQLTNVRVVADKNTSTGYHTDYAPFPGWQKVPNR